MNPKGPSDSIPLLSPQAGCCVLQLDKSSDLASHYGWNVDDPAIQSHLRSVMTLLVRHLSPETTGVLLDPDVSYYALPAKDPQCDVAFCLDTQTIERDPLKTPPLITHWGIKHIGNNSAVAKLELYYNPFEPEAAQKKALVAELYDYAQHEQVPFLLQLLLFEHPAKGHQFDELQLFAAREFASLCDVMALDYPQSPLGAATITAELNIPWILSHRTETYDVFKEALRISTESGAVGYLAGQVLWSDTEWWKEEKLNLTSAEETIKATVRDRVIELGRIVREQLAKQPTKESAP